MSDRPRNRRPSGWGRTRGASGAALAAAVVLLTGSPAAAQQGTSGDSEARDALPAFARKVGLHNFAGAHAREDGPGVALQRVPEDVRRRLNDKSAAQMRRPVHSEIRFVLEEGQKLAGVRIVLEAPGQATMSFFCGDYEYFGGSRRLRGKEAVHFRSHGRFRKLQDRLPRGRYANRVCRIVITGGPVRLLDVRGDVRPPRPDELAPVMLSYGTSITDGARASRGVLAWNALTARELGYDLVNLGSSGSAFCDRAMADHIAGRPWDLAVFELSVNMLGNGFSVGEFRRRAEYLVNEAAASHPDAPVACISILPYFLDHHTNYGQHDKLVGYREALKRICAESPHENVHFIPGPELLPFPGLTQDVLHPSDHGMIELADRLSARLRRILPGE